MSGTHKDICHICGKEAELTFEHIPPKKAFNWHRAKIYNGYGALSKSQGEPAKYNNSQQGMGKYSLCQSCNNITGAWYAADYCNFAMSVLHSRHQNKPLTHGDVVTYRFKDLSPLQIVKQIVAMFCSVLPYQEVHRLGFDKLLLERENNTINRELFDLRMYLSSSENGQIMCGPTAVLYKGIDGSIDTSWVADIGAYPFGYILNLTPEIPVKYGISILDMFDVDYDDKCEFALSLMYLERKDNALPLPLMFKDLSQ